MLDVGDPLTVDDEVTPPGADAGARRRLATGETRHFFCNRDRKPTKLPEKYRAAFGIAR